MKTKDDIRMLYLSAFAIIFVLLGHLGYLHTSVFTFDEWFGYYAFHMPLFLFISGYFYKETYDSQVGQYLLKKVKNILLPFFGWSLVFLLLQSLLLHLGFQRGQGFSFYNWIVWPFLHTQQETLAVPIWYLFAFFICSVVFVLLRKLSSLLIRYKKAKDIVLLILFLVIGMACVFIKTRLNASDTAIVYLRSGVMLFFMQLGFVYKNYLEGHDLMRNLPYFAIIFGIRFLMILLSAANGSKLSFGLFALTDFGNTGISYYVAGILGIALWLRIAKILSTLPKKLNLLARIGENTKYIMIFHLTGYFVLNLILWGVSHFTSIFGFDKQEFLTQIFYYNADGIGQMTLVYLVFGLGISLLIAELINVVRRKIRGLSHDHNAKVK